MEDLNARVRALRMDALLVMCNLLRWIQTCHPEDPLDEVNEIAELAKSGDPISTANIRRLNGVHERLAAKRLGTKPCEHARIAAAADVMVNAIEAEGRPAFERVAGG
jgi:hypothetical protein